MDRGWQRTNRADRCNVKDSAFALTNHLLVDRLRYREQTAYVRVCVFIARKHLAQRRANPTGSTSNKCTLSFEQQTHSYSLPTRDTAANFFNQLRALKD